jgi:hypothetical protein
MKQKFFGFTCSNPKCQVAIPFIALRTDEETPPNPIDSASKGSVELQCPKCATRFNSYVFSYPQKVSQTVRQDIFLVEPSSQIPFISNFSPTRV